MQKKQNEEKQPRRSATKKNNGIHNGEIIAVSVCVVFLMLGLVWNIVDYMLHEKEEAINNSFFIRDHSRTSWKIPHKISILIKINTTILVKNIRC